MYLSVKRAYDKERRDWSICMQHVMTEKSARVSEREGRWQYDDPCFRAEGNGRKTDNLTPLKRYDMRIYARTSMVKVQDAPSVAHEEMSKEYRALQQGAYLQFCRISAAQGTRIDLLVHLDASIDLRTRHGSNMAGGWCRLSQRAWIHATNAWMLPMQAAESIQALQAGWACINPLPCLVRRSIEASKRTGRSIRLPCAVLMR